ncbi:MAG: fibronectin type III domain-containing protein [Clostridia bacterium]|nr:fibronectin type III domain-containing protein [Clostridia bacterium]
MKTAWSFLKTGVIFLLICAILLQTAEAQASSAFRAADSMAPSAPKKLTVTNKTCTSVSFSWTASTDNNEVKGYEVYRDGKRIVTVSKTCYTNMCLVPGRNYTYTIKAYDSSGNISVSSAVLHVTTNKDLQPPASPHTLAANSPTCTTIALSWASSTDNTGIKGYEVFCNGKKTALTSATSYVCKKLLPGTTYTFTVKALDIAGNYSLSSNTCLSGTLPDTTAPSMPGGLKAAEVSYTEVNLVWNSSSENVKVKSYEIFCDGIKKGSTTKTSYTSKNLIPGRSYTYTVRALDTSGNISTESPKLHVLTKADTEPPKAPDGFKTGSISKSSVSLKWKASNDNTKVKGYYVYCNGIKIAETIRTSYTVKGLGNLSIAVFYIKAYDISGNLSENSKTIGIIIV